MPPSNELVATIKEHASELKEISSGLAANQPAKVVAGLASLSIALATGHPEVAALLSPFLDAGLRNAFASTATKRLLAEVAKYEGLDEKNAFIKSIAERVETLLGQALIQLVKAQQEPTGKIMNALGGLRADLLEFREEFQDRIDEGQMRVDVQRVRDGATGVHMSGRMKTAISIGEQSVAGLGSVGIRVGKE